ncbi:beta-lactamase family protein [Streptomyces sp. NBC_00201]|uniref:serine hydrolase domain-containing protein n=1 Tax=unclassified Streptomyces TaxID=2593676 RepID=UPI002253B1D2|nr:MULTISPECIES: serine hydrolase domain-containing protein [unclassified Streptomyces]MCX5063722.1 beta-lactamase family protein [Streptomyces sp. NBC_00452]MCX5251877.1 beta-lactamase family protein [Streptomyces sp. NBC_00201]MCX5294220.1 beta-lactamase family protein [Streptomyces sp. NBC_00183]
MIKQVGERGKPVHRLDGGAEEGFTEVKQVFASLAEADPDHDMQVAVYHCGRLVVDLWAGPEMRQDSLLNVASVGKAAAYVCAALLVQQGDLELDRTVARYWPEFAVAGKQDVTVRQLLSHQAGLVGVDGGFTLDELHDDQAAAVRLASQRPFWRPGTAHGYHGFTIGPMIGELVRRITGSTLPDFHAAMVREPRRIDMFVGLSAEYEPRVLTLQSPVPSEQAGSDPVPAPAPDSLAGLAFSVPVADRLGLVNARRFRAAGPVSMGVLASAHGIARMYASCLDAVDGLPALLAAETQEEFAQIHSVGHDLTLACPSRYGLGFQLPGDAQPYLSARTFGHDGGGGSWGFADPSTRLAFGYVRRRMTNPGGLGPDAHLLARAARACAAGQLAF